MKLIVLSAYFEKQLLNVLDFIMIGEHEVRKTIWENNLFPEE